VFGQFSSSIQEYEFEENEGKSEEYLRVCSNPMAEGCSIWEKSLRDGMMDKPALIGIGRFAVNVVYWDLLSLCTIR
jgi:hypothetical protein